MKYLYLLIALMVVPASLYAQTSQTQINGIVYNEVSKPLEGATITLYNSSSGKIIISLKSDRWGRFLF